jgi:uncharacterized membrane protein YjfL (UPF0719 family)
MELEFLGASLINLSLNLLYTLVALFVGIKALIFVDDKLLKDVNIREEIKNGNIAVALFASSILLFVAIIVTFGFKA